MANCPKCGSGSIQVKQETNVSWGRAVVGYALFGIVGGAVGAVTGEDRNANFCLDCGTSWKAAILYDVLQFIKKETNISLDLSVERDRQFLNEVMPLISSFSAGMANLDSERQSSIVKKHDQGFTAWGCLLPLAFCFGVSWLVSLLGFRAFGTVLFFLLIIPAIVGFMMLDLIIRSPQLQQATESINLDYDDLKKKEEEMFRQKFEYLCKKYF